MGLVTISVCTYLVLNGQALYERLKPGLKLFERRMPFREHLVAPKPEAAAEIILFGLNSAQKRKKQAT